MGRGSEALAMVLVVALASALVLFQGPVAGSKGEVYTNGDLGVSIVGPEGWVKDITDPDLLVAFYAPMTEEGTGVSMNIGYDNVGSTVTIEKLARDAKKDVEKELGVSIRDRAVTVAGRDAWEFVYTYNVLFVTMKLRQILVIGGSKAYIVTFGAPIDLYDEHLPAFEASLGSLEIESAYDPMPPGTMTFLWIVGVVVASGIAYGLRRRQSSKEREATPAHWRAET